MKRFLLPLLCLMILCSVAEANKFSVTGFSINNSELMSFKELNETAITSDTLTTSESGKHFFPNIGTGDIVFTLPTAATGLTYKFTSINGNAIAGQGRVILTPQSTDTFVACVNGSSETTFAAGDTLYSPEATGDLVTITGTASNQWVCGERIGTWVDGN